MKNGYVTTKHPITGQRIQGVPNGQTRTTPSGIEAEIMVITPRSNLTTIWVKRGELFEE